MLSSYGMQTWCLLQEMSITRHNYPVRTAYLPFVDYTTVWREPNSKVRTVYENADVPSLLALHSK